MSFVKAIHVVNPKTFRISLKEQTGLVLTALGRPSSNVPFMMPKRVAETDPNTEFWMAWGDQRTGFTPRDGRVTRR